MPRPLLGAVPASSAPVPKGTAAPSKVEGAATSTSAERTAAAIEAEVEAGSGGSVDGAVDFLTLLPEDLGPDHILPLLDAPTCARCAAVSRRWRKQARLERLWRAHCQALWTGKAVRLNHESPWVRTAPPVNGIPTSEAVACPVLHGGASRADGLALTWFESYGASLESRGRIALTDHDLVCNDWLITFADATVAFLPPNLLAIILSDEEELRAKFDCATSGRRYTDGVFFRSHGPAEGHTAHWCENRHASALQRAPVAHLLSPTARDEFEQCCTMLPNLQCTVCVVPSN